MAENDVGGIGVRFTAEAGQLQQEIQKLDQRLRQFDSAHGQTKIRLQAELVMPGARAMADFRRGMEKSFGAQGSAGRVKARIELLPPTATDIRAISAKVGSIKVKVVGNFEWGTAPPKTVTVKVVEQIDQTTSRAKRGTISQQASKTVVAAQAQPTHEEIQRSREAYRRAEREAGGAASFARGSAFVGGAASFARGGGGDDPYQQNILREQRASMHDAAKTKALAQEARDRARADEVERKWAARGASLTPHEAALRNVELREAGIGEPLGPGGQIPLGLPGLGPRESRTADRRPRATPPPPVGHQLPLRWPSPEPGHGPMAGVFTGHTVMERMQARDTALPFSRIHGESGFTQLGMQAAVRPIQAEAEATRPRRIQEAIARPLGVGPRTAGLVDPNDLNVPSFLRPQPWRRGVQQAPAQPMAAEVDTIAAGVHKGLQQTLDAPGRIAGLPTAGPEGPEGEEGEAANRPHLAARALARAGLDPEGRPLSAEPGSPQARVQELLKSSRQAVQLAQGTGQVRAVGTTTGGLFANILGGKAGRELVARDLTTLRHALEDFTAEGSEAGQAFERVAKAQTNFNQASLSGKGNTSALAKELQAAKAAAQPYAETVEVIGDRINKLQGQISPLKQATVGFASSIAGTIVGLGIFNAVSAGIEGIGNALKEPSDRLLGFRRIGEQTGTTLGQLTRQYNGLSSVAVSTATAQSGLGDSVIEQIRPLLDQRAAVEAGNSAFRDQLDLIRSAGFFGRNPGAGITQTTGGLLGTPVGGQQPFLEQLLQSGSPVGGPLESRLGTVGINAAAGAAAGAAFGTLIPLPGLGTATGALAGGVIGGVSGLLQSADQPESATLGERARSGQLTDEETDRLDEFRSALATVNDGLDKANPKLKETAHFVELLGNTGPAADEAVRNTQRLLSELPGITKDQLQAAKDLRFALIDPKTGLSARVAPQGLGRVLTEALRGVSLPSRQEAAFQTARQITAALDLNQQQGRLQRETLIPGQSFLRQLFAGRAPTGGQVNIPNPLTQGTASLPPEVLNRPGIDTSQLTRGLSQVETQANAGRDALVGMIKSADTLNQQAGISSNLLGTFNDLTKAAGATAATIRGISQASAWMQVNLQVKQINEQIFVMSRSLEDAKSFLSGAGTGELGLLQNRARGLEIAQAELGFRQQSLSLANQELGIQASTLQLQQRQRQINFQRAIAGFVAPGQTPEEIAARQKEAGLEADFAQKQQNIGVTQLENQKASVALAREQLGISKEQFAVAQAMVTVSAERAIGDLSRNIGLLQEQARVTVQLQVNSDAIDAYQAVLEEQKAQIESVIQEAYSVQQTVMSNAAALAAQYGGRITEWNNILIKALSDYVARAGAAIAGFKEAVAGQYAGDFGVTGPSGGGGGGGGAETNATGFYGSVSGATQMTVGEAGPETVAILRNPRSMTWTGNQNGGSASPTIIVNVTGNNVGSQQDADELAATIARKVEETMSRRSSLLGLRAN